MVAPRPLVLGLAAIVAVAACGGARRRDDTGMGARKPDPDEHQELDLCLGDRAEPFDAATVAAIAAAWQALARGEHPAPMHLRKFSAGRCVASWWQPVVPLAGCGAVDPRQRWMPMRDAGTVVLDVATGTFTVRPPGVELFEIDGHVVTRTDAGAIAIETARGAVTVPGFPERVIDDDHAIIADGAGMTVYDLVAGKPVRPVRPRKPGKKDAPGSVAATDVVRDPAAPLGARLISGVVFGAEWEAFAIDGRGKLLTSVRGPASLVAMPVITPEGAVVLVAYHTGTITITTVTGRGKPTTRDVAFDGGAIDHLIKLSVTAGGDVVVVGFATRAAVIRAGADVVTVDAKTGNRVEPTLLAGGNVAVIAADANDGTFAIDTRTGTELAHVDDRTPRFTVGAASVVLVDPRAQNANEQAIVIGADGTVKRGAVGETTIGRFTVRSFAGVADPSMACDARALSALPPLVQYGDYILPTDLVVD